MPRPKTPEPKLEQDSRFPSGPWTGFFLQPLRAGRQWMELRLSFREGRVEGEGRDWVGSFTLRGRYEVADGKCRWIKTYVGRHSLYYTGFNEGKGIWGTWEQTTDWRGGFHIWPEGMPDPTRKRLSETQALPAVIGEPPRPASSEEAELETAETSTVSVEAVR